MSRRTKWIIAAAAALLGAAPASAQSDVLGTASLGRPVNELPIPLMWGEKDEGFFFSTEFAVMRINNVLSNQTVARRGFIDRDGSIRGTGATIDIFDTATPPNYFTTLFVNRGPAGAVYGSGTEALNTSEIANQLWQPGTRVTLGYRLRNGVVIEASYMGITKSRSSASAGIIPQNGSTNQDGSDSYLYGDYFNFAPYLAGPSREIVSNVFLQPIPPGTTGALGINPVPQDLQTLGGFAVSAYGITNGAEYWSISELLSIHTSELNMRVPVAQFEGTRTYWTGGLRYISFTERFRMTVEDHGFPDNIATTTPFSGGQIDNEVRGEWNLRYTVKQKDLFYGLQTGVGGDAYITNGFGMSVDLKVGVLAQHSKQTTVLQNTEQGLIHSNNLFSVAGMFQGGAYLWWYAHEGITFRAGYEYLGIYGAQRMPNPIDYDWGRLNPNGKKSYLSLDGLTFGVSFTF